MGPHRKQKKYCNNTVSIYLELDQTTILQYNALENRTLNPFKPIQRTQTSICLAKNELNRTGWFRSTLGFDLLGFRSILVSICTRYQFQTAHYSIYTNSDLHSFRSALFSLCNFWICKDFALLSIRSAQISICTDFDLHVFRYANQF